MVWLSPGEIGVALGSFLSISYELFRLDIIDSELQYLLIPALLGIGFIPGIRWQLKPLQISLALLFIQKIFSFHSWIVLILCVIISLGSLIAFVLFPLPTFPEVTGPYLVSSRNLAWVTDATTPRRHFAKVWFPFIPSDASKEQNDIDLKAKNEEFRKVGVKKLLIGEKVLARKFISYFGQSLKQPEVKWVLDHLAYHGVPTNSYHLPATYSFPKEMKVLIFSTGLYGFAELHTFLGEQLASHGYFVICVRHTDGSHYVLNDEGNVEYEFEYVNHKIGSLEDVGLRNRQIRQREADVRASIEHLRATNEKEWRGQLNLDSFVMVGHSFGGGTTVASVLHIPDIVGGICLDGWLFPHEFNREPEGGLEARFKKTKLLFLNSELWQYRENLNRIQRLLDSSNGSWEQATLLGSQHHNFDEAPIWFGDLVARRFAHLVGPLDYWRGVHCICRVIMNFAEKVYENPHHPEMNQFSIRGIFDPRDSDIIGFPN